MSTLSDIRVLIGDIAEFDRQTATGDGASTKYQVTSYPIITDSDSVTVGGTAKTRGTDYTVDVERGVITFTTAPSNAAAVVIFYNYAQLSDESINALVVLKDDTYAAAAMAAESLAAKYARISDLKVGDLSISYSQRAKDYREMAARLWVLAARAAVRTPYAGGISIADKEIDQDNTDRVQPAFSVGMHSVGTVTTATEEL